MKMLIHSSMFRDLPARKDILSILFRSQRSFADCVRGRQPPTISRMIAVNIYAKLHVDDGHIRHIRSSHSPLFSSPCWIMQESIWQFARKPRYDLEISNIKVSAVFHWKKSKKEERPMNMKNKKKITFHPECTQYPYLIRFYTIQRL